MIIVKNLTKKQKHKISKKIRYVLNDTILVDIIENLNSRMVSNVLTNLVQKGLVESAFDSQKNDFVFWIKNNENPKTDSN
jgi:predicted transcriptional regulator